MFPLFRRSFFILCALVLAFLPACRYLGLDTGRPSVVISAPASGTEYRTGQEIAITSTATDPQGISRIELLVDSISVHTDPSPVLQGQAQFQVIQTWKATGTGTHTVTVRAYNTQGTFGDAGIVVSVGEDAAMGTTPIQIVTPVPINTLAPVPTSPNPTAFSTDIPAPVATPVTGSTPGPTNCAPDSTFVADVTIPDGSVISPGAAFTKAWRVQNSGTCPWDASYAMQWVSGAQMSSQAVFPILSTPQGATVDLAIPMTAPSAPGVYTSIWRLRDSYGNSFGTNLTVVIRAGSPTAPTPTRTTGPGLPVISYFGCNPCAVTAGQSTILKWGLVTNATSASIDQGIGGIATPGTFTTPPLNATTTFVLTATGPGGTSQAFVTVSVSTAVNFAGFWYLNFGTMQLTQNGGAVHGTFTNQLSGVTGSVSGNVSANVVNGTWTNNLAQTGQFHWALNGNQITGNWNGIGANKWCGARTGAEFPNGCSFDGHWNIGGAIACPAMSMELRRVDMTITGTWCNTRTISGSISYSGGETVLIGTSTYAPTTNPISFYLDGYSALQWSGHYVYSGGNTAEWCGWRDSSSKPNPCYQ